MKVVRVEIPFKELAKNKVHKVGSKIELPDETVARLQSINQNIVTVLEDIPDTEPDGQTATQDDENGNSEE